MILNSKDRWKEVIERIIVGADIGKESPHPKKNDKLVTIGGREMNIKEAALLSGLSRKFFNSYVGEEVPLEDISKELDKKWTKEKMAKLRIGKVG